jgi:hypothetical protein
MAISNIESVLDTLRDETHKFSRSAAALCAAIDQLQLPTESETDAAAKLRALIPALTVIEEHAEDLGLQAGKVPELTFEVELAMQGQFLGTDIDEEVDDHYVQKIQATLAKHGCGPATVQPSREVPTPRMIGDMIADTFAASQQETGDVIADTFANSRTRRNLREYGFRGRNFGDFFAWSASGCRVGFRPMQEEATGKTMLLIQISARAGKTVAFTGYVIPFFTDFTELDDPPKRSA